MNIVFLLFFSGIVAGIVGYVLGLASLISFPVLLAVGIPPVEANATNTMALVGNGLGSTFKAGTELKESSNLSLASWVIAASAGGLLGGAILVLTPSSSFETLVPFLVLSASLLVLAEPRLSHLATRTSPPWVFVIGLFVISMYGGYFGAGAGVVFLTLSLYTSQTNFRHSMLLKTVLLSVANLAAAVLFAFAGLIHWIPAIIMSLGFFIGGWCGPSIARLIPVSILRMLTTVAGIGLSLWLWMR